MNSSREPIIPYISLKNAAKGIEFYKKAFGAEELYRIEGPDGKIGHAEILIDGAKIMLAEEHLDMGFPSPETLQGTPVTLSLSVSDVDAFTTKAIGAGLKVLRKVEDQFYGDRGGKFQDPFGHQWWIATHKEDLSADEIKRRAKELFGS